MHHLRRPIALTGVLFSLAAVGLVACGGMRPQVGSRPASASVPEHPMDVLYPHAVSPGSVVPPAMTMTPILPASAMQSLASGVRAVRDATASGFTQLPGAASQAVYAQDGSLWVLSNAPAGPDKNIWRYSLGSWTNVPGLASRIALAPNGTLYAVNAAGGLYGYANGSWTAYGGAASDVAVDVNGAVYVTSLGARGTDTAIYRYARGTWSQLPGAASRLASYPDPYSLYALTAAGTLYQTPLTTTAYTACPGQVSRVVPNANGGFLAVGYPLDPVAGAPLYSYTAQPGNCAGSAYQAIGGSGVDATAFGQAVVVLGSSGGIYQTQVTGVGPTPPPAPQPPGIKAIAHVVIIFQENRTPDNLFNGFPGADTQNYGINSAGARIPLGPVDLANNYDLDHSHTGWKNQWDNGRMDGADKVGMSCPSGTCLSTPQFKYVPQSQVQPYWTMAQQYAFADRMFQTNQGPSFPAHQYIISGTSLTQVGGTLLNSENVNAPGIGSGGQAGCAAPAGTVTSVIDPNGIETKSTYPCFEHQTLMDSLDARKLAWRYYGPSAASIWTAPNAIAHLRNGPDWANVVYPAETTLLNDISAGNLGAVTWVNPTGANSDHAQANNGGGPAWVASIVNAIGQSPNWNTTAIFVTWDDWGGWYDHVAPPQIYNAYELGFRVPLIAISPYAKSGYVSHNLHEFGSILKFTEEAFGLPSLGYTDARADDLGDMFDFTQTPRAFRTIQANRRAADFLTAPHDTARYPDGD